MGCGAACFALASQCNLIPGGAHPRSSKVKRDGNSSDLAGTNLLL